MSKFEIEKKLNDAKLACGAVCTIAESMENEQIKERNMLVEIDDKSIGKIRIPAL